MAKYNKALVLPLVIVLAIITQAAGLDLGLDVEHYIGLLLVDVGIFAVPNKDAS